MKKNDIIAVLTLAGEYVGKFVSDENGLELEDPRMIVQGPEGQMGFARGICQTGVENPTSVKFSEIFPAPPNCRSRARRPSRFQGLLHRPVSPGSQPMPSP